VPDSLPLLLSHWQSDPSLFDPHRICERMHVLDQLDAHFPELISPSTNSQPFESALHSTASALRARLESANSNLFQSLRHEIRQGICPQIFHQIISDSVSPSAPGNSYDYLDDLLAGVLQLQEPAQESAPTGPENVFYQPTPARHIFSMIRTLPISASDVFIDLGSGLGHVPLLVSICSAARCIGIELQPAYVESARHSARDLNLANITFLEQDAQLADLSSGTVFYLYTPFTGSILRSVLNSLRHQAARRPIEICSFGPCTHTIAKEPWLDSRMPPDPDRVTLFVSHC
jgi:Histone methylation protein DOT1